MYIDPEVVTSEALNVLDTSVELATSWQSSSSLSSVPAHTAGNTNAGARVEGALATLASAASVAVESLVGSLEAASEGMQGCAFALTSADEDAAEAMRVQ